jgi:hypothetical protein
MSIQSKQSKVLQYLSKSTGNNTLTAKKMQSLFGIANPSAVINTLRAEGNPIYLNTRKLANGKKVSFYRLGAPTKEMIAAGILTLRQHKVRVFA